MTQDPVTFKHPVGKSTLVQGLAIRRDYEAWFAAPDRGQARAVVLRFGSQEVEATLRRLDNENGNVQIRYGSRQQAPLREWLQRQFGVPGAVEAGALLELRRLDRDLYELAPVVGKAVEQLHLCLGPGLYHNNARAVSGKCPAFGEIDVVVRSVRFAPLLGQSHYNTQIRERFVERGWGADGAAVPELPLRFDFKKDDVQVEVEFGNARSYYQDYLKFLLPFTRGIIRIGVLLVPTGDFARLLCAAGTRRAIARASRGGLALDRPPMYSGMVTYEKVEREFEALRFVLNMPLVVRGIDFWGRA